MYGIDIRHDQACGRRRHLGDDALDHRQGSLVDALYDLGESAVLVIFSLVEGGHVYTPDFRKLDQEFTAWSPTLFPCLVTVHDILNHFLAFTNHERVDESVHRLGIIGGMASGDDQGVARVPFRAE